MAKSTISTYPAGGLQYSIGFDYLSRNFVIVTLINSSDQTKNVVLTPNNDYRFLGANTIEIMISQSGFDTLRIHRQTSSELIVSFRDGSVLTASDLTNSELQAIHIAEEGRDQTVDLAKEYADAAGEAAEQGKDYLEETKDLLSSNGVDSKLRTDLVEGQTLNMSPLYYGAKADLESDISANDTAFTALELKATGRIIDLGGKVYRVSREYTGNKYVNGSFRTLQKMLPDAEYAESRVQTRGAGRNAIHGFAPSLPYHVKSGLNIATIKNTVIQGAVLDYYDNLLYTLENVSGSAGTDDEINKVVMYRWYGQGEMTKVWETLGSNDIGHQSLGLTIGRVGYRNTRGQLQLWGLAGVSKGAQRAQYITRFTPAAGSAITPEFFRVWDDTYLNHVNVLCTDPSSTWLITTAKRYVGPPEVPGALDQLRYYVKVYNTSVFTNPAAYDYDYRDDAMFEFEVGDFVRDMQAVACDGNVIYFCQAGSAYSSTRKFLHMYTLDGVYLGVQQIQAGAGRAYDIADPTNSGAPNASNLLYEPEAMFFRPIIGGWDLVMGNTNGIPDGDTGRETSFYTLRPQQALHIKTTSGLLPGLIVDAAHDVCSGSGLLTFGTIEKDGTITDIASLSGAGLTVEKVGTDAAQFIAKNSLRTVSFHVSAGGDAGIYDSTNSRWIVKSATPMSALMYIGQPLEVDGPVRSFVDNVNSSGTATRKWTQVHATNGTINTSDRRLKTLPKTVSELSAGLGALDDAILDAWGDVNVIAYQWLSDVKSKGADLARWHFGAIAQQVRDAFLSRGIDGTRFGLLCYDEWEDEYQPVTAVRDVTTAVRTEEGEEVIVVSKEEYETGEKRLVLSAGNRWGLRPSECFWLEAAYQRRRMDRFESRLAALGA